MHQKIRLIFSASMLAGLVACGGGSGTTTPVASTVKGVAATGLAISGATVTLKCVSGTATYPSTGTDGSFSIDVSNVTLPCVARVDYKDANGVAQKLHSFVSAAGNANITPVTELLVASLTGGTSANAFDAFDATKIKAITAAQISDAIAKTKAYITGLGVTATAMLDDPVGTKFTPKTGTAAGDVNDQMLDALKANLGSKTIETAASEVPRAVAGTSTNASGAACSGTNLIFTGSVTGGPVNSGDAVCFTTATATSLAFTLPTGSISLSNPGTDSGGFKLFTDTNSHLGYEIIFDGANKVQEINVVNTTLASSASNYFVGQFAPDPAVACPAKGGTAIPAGQAFGGACKMPQTTQVACTAAGYSFEPLGGGICWTNP